jgi:hypothetical protein
LELKLEVSDEELRAMLKKTLNREPTKQEITAFKVSVKKGLRQWLLTQASLIAFYQNQTIGEEEPPKRAKK